MQCLGVGNGHLLRVGEVATADRWAEQLNDQVEKHSLGSYHPCALGFKGQLSAERGDVVTAVRLLRAALEGARKIGYHHLYTVFASDLALAEAEAGRLDQGLATIDEALQRAERSEELYYVPEALRIKGELLLMQDKSASAVAETDFSHSLALARRQGALSWELRAATSLTRLLRDQNRIGEARDLLSSVYSRFTEGFETADLQSAKRLLDELA